MLNYHGQEVHKPLNYRPIVKVEKVIYPINRMPFASWGAAIHAELTAIENDKPSNVPELELVELNVKEL